jgi:hypothetical protein
VDIRAQTAGHTLSLGIALITLAFFCSAVMSAFSKAASGVPPLLILFLQYGISFLILVKLQRFCKKEVGQTGPFEFS